MSRFVLVAPAPTFFTIVSFGVAVVGLLFAIVRLVHHYLDRIAHTCTVEKGTGSTPEYPRGSQCKPADEYKGWMKDGTAS